MAKAKVFISGNSQAVRLPKSMRLDACEVEIRRKGNSLVLTPVPATLAGAFEILAGLSDDFFAEGRDDPPPETREPL